VATTTRPLRLRLRRLVVRAGPRRRPTIERWRSGKSHETEFWTTWFATHGDEWPEAYQQRLDPEAPLQDAIRELLPREGRVAILDVGAGPVTVLGKRSDRHIIELSATDALADEYDAILDHFGIVPPVRTVRCDTERLTERFARDTFDLVNAENTLDHHYDALAAIDQMVAVTKPGGVITMRHATNEGETADYTGLHQWNFELRDGDPFLWSPTTSMNLDAFLDGRAVRIATELTPSARGEEWLRLVYRKLATRPG
jgi:SAM-dependent methyltransferase